VGALVSTRAHIAALYSAAQLGPDNTESIAYLETRANDLERHLAEKLPVLLPADHPTVAAVRRRLATGEATVEVLKFRENDGDRFLADSHYMALILKSDDEEIHILDLGVAGRFEPEVLNAYSATIKSELASARGFDHMVPPPGKTNQMAVTRLLWEPLRSAIGDVSRIYFSPDGVLNTINLGAIPITSDKRLLEVVDLRVLNSTRDLLVSVNNDSNPTAVLVGAPDFDLDFNQDLGATGTAQTLQLRSRDQRGGSLSPLPGTEEEVSRINELIRRRGWKVELYTGALAQESAVESVHHPRVLHLATHGFFLNEQLPAPGTANAFWEDPMLRSGLYLAGANRTLKGTPPPGEDGVLTSSEVMGLDLQGKELVVLSACETGLGTVQSGEGVFGLRRALQVAGARSVLMSLWSVPDRETGELMMLFYEGWLSGKEKSEALRQAQIEMRSRVKTRYGSDIPYYWAAFVLAGE
jgi:CHAT domain-containing protein